jgi:hypothetical protein
VCVCVCACACACVCARTPTWICVCIDIGINPVFTLSDLGSLTYCSAQLLFLKASFQRHFLQSSGLFTPLRENELGGSWAANQDRLSNGQAGGPLMKLERKKCWFKTHLCAKEQSIQSALYNLYLRRVQCHLNSHYKVWLSGFIFVLFGSLEVLFCTVW